MAPRHTQDGARPPLTPAEPAPRRPGASPPSVPREHFRGAAGSSSGRRDVARRGGAAAAAAGAGGAGARARRGPLQPGGGRGARPRPPDAGGRRQEPAGAGRGDRGGAARRDALGAERRGRGGGAGRQPRGAALRQRARRGAAAERAAEAARRPGGLQQGHGQQVAAARQGGARRPPRLPRRGGGAGPGAGEPAAGAAGGGRRAARARPRRPQAPQAAAGSHPQVLLAAQGQRLQHGGDAPGDGADAGDDRHRLVAAAALQGVQLRGAGAAAGLRPPAPAAQGALAVPAALPGDGVHGDAYQQLRGELLLELRRPLPAPAAPGARPARHLLPAGPRRGGRAARRLHGQSEEGAFARRLRLAGVQVRVEGGGSAQEPAAHAHHGRQRPHALPPGPGEVCAGEVLLGGPGVPQREPGRHAPGRVPPGRGRRGRPRPGPRPPPRRPRPVLRQAGHHAAALQARLQPLHGAQRGGVLLPPRAEEVGGGGELRGLPPRAAAAHGAARGRLRHRLGALAGAPHHGQIRHQQHPGAGGAPRQPADGLRQPPVPPRRLTPPPGGAPPIKPCARPCRLRVSAGGGGGGSPGGRGGSRGGSRPGGAAPAGGKPRESGFGCGNITPFQVPAPPPPRPSHPPGSRPSCRCLFKQQKIIKTDLKCPRLAQARRLARPPPPPAGDFQASAANPAQTGAWGGHELPKRAQSARKRVLCNSAAFS